MNQQVLKDARQRILFQPRFDYERLAVALAPTQP